MPIMKKHFSILIVLLLLLPAAAWSETLYVTDLREITFRTGPGIQHKVIDMVRSGERVQVLETSEGWKKVRLENGKEGWVMTRWLTADKPNAMRLETTQEEHEKLAAEHKALQEAHAALKEKEEALMAELAEKEAGIASLQDLNNALREQTPEDFQKMQSEYEASAAQLDQLKERVVQQKQRIREMESDRRLWWGLSGALVLLVGVIIGYSMKRDRRRSYLM